MDPITLALMLGGLGAKAITGAFQASRAQKGINALSKQAMPQFNITPEQQRSYNRAEENAQTGYSGAEKSALNQRLAGASNLAYRRATDIGGGNGARAIQGALGASMLGANNQMAMNDALLKRSNVRYADQVGSSLSAQRNMETQRAFNYRVQLERALGAAKTQGVENIANAFGNLGTMAAYGAFKKTTPTDGIQTTGGGSGFGGQGGQYNYMNVPFQKVPTNPFITPDQIYPNQQPLFLPQ